MYVILYRTKASRMNSGRNVRRCTTVPPPVKGMMNPPIKSIA